MLDSIENVVSESFDGDSIERSDKGKRRVMTLEVPEDLYKLIRIRAATDNRTVSSYVRKVCIESLK
jgi:hypothetical protein